MSKTTIKVSSELRDRINKDAKDLGLSAAGLIENLLNAYERQRRMESFGKAFRNADSDYWDEFRSWDLAMGEPQDAA